MTNNGYRGSSTLKKSNIPIQWTPELVEEFMKCKADPIYFAENYMKIVNVDKGLITIPLYSYQKDIIRSIVDERFTIAECARQSGKALPLDTPIPTPDGWRTMGDLQPGDRLFDETGKETFVKSISKTFTNHDCFRITFDDGSAVNADADHLWVVNKSSNRDTNPHKLTTKELFDSGITKIDSRGKRISLWKIPVANAVQYKSVSVPIDPYILGLWLGDGSAADGRITASFEDFAFYKKELKEEFSHNHSPRNLYTGTIYGLSPKLRSLNLLNNKHIPSIFLLNDIETRLALIQGLMDSDGTIEKSGRLCLALSYSKHPKLIEDAYELIASLGIKVTRKEYPKTNSCRLYFQCPKNKFKMFRLPRKLAKQPDIQIKPKHTDFRFIRNIERIDSVPTKCIEVANESHLFLCSKHFIPTHNTTAITVAVLWYIIFHKHKTVAVLANKGETAREILGRIQLAYEHLPQWLQQGVVEWNKGSFVLENNSRVIAAATSANNIRGFSINMLIIDEAAHIENWDAFYTSVFPTISSGKETKIVLISTVNGLNHFWEFTQNARKGKNNYNLISVSWEMVPGRDQKWKEDTLAQMNHNNDKFAQEFENRYLGSSGTLIAGWKLEQLSADIPLSKKLGISMYKRAQKDRTYVAVADVSHGKGLDYSAIQIIDITKMPYEQVLVFRDNFTTPGDFAEIINRVCREYNHAALLVEVNDIGQHVAESLYFDYEYDNILFTESAGKNGKRITHSYKSNSTDRGIRTTKTVKAIGCSMLKLLVEQDQLLIRDSLTIWELSKFSKKNNTYAAEEGATDDLTMCLVLFSWLTEQQYFKDLTNINTLINLREFSEEQLLNDLTPFGFIDDGETDSFDDDFGNRQSGSDNWVKVEMWRLG